MFWIKWWLRKRWCALCNDPSPCLLGGEHDWVEEIEQLDPGLRLVTAVVFCSKCLEDP